MLEDLGLGSLGLGGFSATGTIDTIFTWAIILIGLGIVVFGGWFTLLWLKFKHTIRIKEVVKGRKIIYHDKFREHTKDGITYYQLWKKRVKLPVAPPEAIEVNHRGKKDVDVFLLEDGSYIYAKDVCEPVPKEINEITDIKERKEAIKKYVEKNPHTIVAYKPFGTKQKLIWLDQFVKAESKKKKRWTEHIPTIASLASLTIIVIALLAFWGEIAQPAIDSKQITTAQLKIMNDIVETQQEMKQNIQIIKDKLKIKDETIKENE